MAGNADQGQAQWKSSTKDVWYDEGAGKGACNATLEPMALLVSRRGRWH